MLHLRKALQDVSIGVEQPGLVETLQLQLHGLNQAGLFHTNGNVSNNLLVSVTAALGEACIQRWAVLSWSGAVMASDRWSARQL